MGRAFVCFAALAWTGCVTMPMPSAERVSIAPETRGGFTAAYIYVPSTAALLMSDTSSSLLSADFTAVHPRSESSELTFDLGTSALIARDTVRYSPGDFMIWMTRAFAGVKWGNGNFALKAEAGAPWLVRTTLLAGVKIHGKEYFTFALQGPLVFPVNPSLTIHPWPESDALSFVVGADVLYDVFVYFLDVDWYQPEPPTLYAGLRVSW